MEMKAQPDEEVMAEGGGPLDDAVLITDSTSQEAAGDSPLWSSHLGTQGHQPPPFRGLRHYGDGRAQGQG